MLERFSISEAETERPRVEQFLLCVLSGERESVRPFNLGHGILPETPLVHVERMLERVRGQRST